MRLRTIALYTALLTAGWLLCPPALTTLTAQSKENPELTATLAQVDAVSAKFSSFAAKFTQKHYLALLKEFETPETGEFWYALDRHKGGDGQNSVRMRHEIIKPGPRITTINGDAATVYQPLSRQAQVYNLGKRKNLVEYLATGLGQSSARLREQFTITYEGVENIGDAPCSVLRLEPKNASAAASVKSITIWFKKSTGTPAQYKFLEPTGDYMLETFSDEKLNGKIPADKFVQKFPRGTEVLKF